MKAKAVYGQTSFMAQKAEYREEGLYLMGDARNGIFDFLGECCARQKEYEMGGIRVYDQIEKNGDKGDLTRDETKSWTEAPDIIERAAELGVLTYRVYSDPRGDTSFWFYGPDKTLVMAVDFYFGWEMDLEV